jgi:hypothetical protein
LPRIVERNASTADEADRGKQVSRPKTGRVDQRVDGSFSSIGSDNAVLPNLGNSIRDESTLRRQKDGK